MAIVGLFDGASGLTSLASTNLGSNTEYAVAFVPTVDGYLRELRWYRPATSPFVPAHLRLWDASTQAVVYEAAVVPDNGSAGWQVHTVTNVIPLTAGREYRVAEGLPAGTHTFVYFNTLPSPPAPLALSTTFRRFNAGAYAFPATTNSNVEYEAVDVGFDTVPPSTSTSPATNTDVLNALDAWLVDNSENSHKDSSSRPGLPYTTKQQVDAVRNKADGATGFDAIKAVADAVNAAVSGLPGTIASAVTTITGQLTTLTGNTAQSGLATIGAISHDVASMYNHTLDVLAGNVITGTSGPHWHWVAGTPVDFDGAIALTEPADAYLLELTTLPQGLAVTFADGVHVVFRAGWWCECLGGVGSERHFVDFEQTWLRDGTRRLGGCLVQLGPAGAGTITPYLLQPV